MNGRRADIDQRPELKYGTVEFTAPEVLLIVRSVAKDYLFNKVNWHTK
jgi:hypothetical protein